MEAIVAQIGVVAGVLIACFSGPVIALFFLLRRKKKVRAARRSPIGKDLLRGPGHTLRQQLHDAGSDLMFDVTLLMILPLMALATFLAQGHVRGLENMGRLAPAYVLLTLALVGYSVRRLLRTGKRLDSLNAGFDAELAVGQELDQLMRQGAVVFHDFPADNFNIDHVVISTHGVYAVETKGYTKPKALRGKAGATVVFDGKALAFPTWTTGKPIEQAERQAAWLTKWISSATGTATSVLPILALSGWFVERSAGRSSMVNKNWDRTGWGFIV